MTLNISDLNPAGSDLFADTDSFLSDLQETEATSVYGGGSNKGGRGGNFVFINKGGYGGGYGGGFYGGGYGGFYGGGRGRGRGGYGGYCH